MNLTQALAAASQISREALSQENATSAYRTIGLEAGKAINVDKVVVERAAELFGSLKAQAKEVPETKSGRKRVFDAVSLIAPPKSACKGCSKKIEVIDRFCKECGSSNPSHDPDLHEIHKSGKRSGWQANAEWLAKVQAQSPEEETIMQKTGDFLKKIRKLNPAGSAAPSTPAPAAAPATPAAPVPPSPAPKPLQDLPAAEFDLENPADCVKLICIHFNAPPPDLEKVAQFYIDRLKSKCTKNQSLSFMFQTEVLKSNLLKKKDSRKAWYDSWKANRASRFVQLPDYL